MVRNFIGKDMTMQRESIYKDIARRTGGDIYLGVVGPVRTGKSTFIRRFLDAVVLPNISNDFDRDRAIDQIPQSAGGRTVMTSEPKFVPDEAVRIKMEDSTELNVKLIDCVGYMVDGALGAEEDGVERMITTPWSDKPMTFKEASEIGTSKVINDHSTIGILVTTDGSITEIPRENYIAAEERVASELKALGKPFVIVLNSAYPSSEGAITLAEDMEKKYGVPVALVNCMEIDGEDMREILGLALGEFPIRMLRFTLPSWCEELPEDHPLRQDLYEKIDIFSDRTAKIGDISKVVKDSEGVALGSIDAGEGCARLALPISKDVYYETLSELCGIDVRDERKMFATVCALAEISKKYKRIESALEDAENKGYGIVMPGADEMTLEEPQVVKQGSAYGVKVSAHAESIHMIKTGIRADLCPMVGTAEQSEQIVKYLSEEAEENGSRIWESNMFGQSLYDLVSEGMNSKLTNMPDESREKLGETLERIINEGAGGLLCILL